MNQSTEDLINRIAIELKVDPSLLTMLIRNESNFNPQAKNPKSSAKGLLQWIDSSAKELGFISSQDLINKLSTVDEQLQHAVLPYLKRKMPFNNPQSLFMAVFYPAARNWPLEKEFPANVQAVNPGIKTPFDYISRVYRKNKLRYVPPVVILLISTISIFFLINKKNNRSRKNVRKK